VSALYGIMKRHWAHLIVSEKMALVQQQLLP
jgi:hypothetical protein